MVIELMTHSGRIVTVSRRCKAYVLYERALKRRSVHHIEPF